MFKKVRRRLRFGWKTAQIASIGYRARRQARSVGTPGLFVDCGSNLGQGFRFFRDYFPAGLFDAVLIEPNPNCAAGLRELISSQPGVELIQAALAAEDGEAQLFGLVEDHRGAVSNGASILDVHNSKFYRIAPERAITVKTRRLSDIIREKSAGHDLIVVKLDVEGAEYAVFDDLVESGMIDKIYAIFIEFHARFMEPETADRFRLLEDRIRQTMRARGIRFVEWI